MSISSLLGRLAKAGLWAALAAGAVAAAAQPAFPERSVRIVMPLSAGSGVDAVLRMVGDKLSQEWRQPVLIDNKPGANGWLAIGEVKRARPDGYTLATVDATHMTLQQHLYKNMPYDPEKDFEPVAPLYRVNFFIVVAANAPWRSVTELLDAARAQGGKMTFGSWGVGSVGHLGAAMLETATGAKMTHVPFKELPQLYTAVANGEVDWAFGAASTVSGLHKAGKVRLLAYAGPRRLPGYTTVPTVAESGGPQSFDVSTWLALYAPKGTPKSVVNAIQAGVNKTMAEPEVRERLTGEGSIFAVEPWPGGPEELARAAAADAKRYADIVKRLDIRME